MRARRVRLLWAAAVAVVAVAAVVTTAIAGKGDGTSVNLSGYQEVPAVSTGATASFRAHENSTGGINYYLSYTGLEGTVQQSHIHFGQDGVNGAVVVFLCSNLGNGPAGTQACPNSPGHISGSFSASDVTGGAAAQGIAAGEFAELLRAMKTDVTYVNIHSSKFPNGETRAKIQWTGP